MSHEHFSICLSDMYWVDIFVIFNTDIFTGGKSTDWIIDVIKIKSCIQQIRTNTLNHLTIVHAYHNSEVVANYAVIVSVWILLPTNPFPNFIEYSQNDCRSRQPSIQMCRPHRLPELPNPYSLIKRCPQKSSSMCVIVPLKNTRPKDASSALLMKNHLGCA